MPENEDAWDLWMASQTQWRAGGMGVIGLDYGCLLQIAQMLVIEWTPAMMLKIQALEAATLKKINKKPEAAK